MTVETLDEKRAAFRKVLEEEMLGPQLWYHKNKPENRDILLKGHPECPYAISKSGTVAKHKYIWWKHHKDEPVLKYNEEIHHINGNHQDNRIENLEKLTIRDHVRKHVQMRKEKEHKSDKPISAIHNSGSVTCQI